MIEWPSEDLVTDDAQKVVSLFKKTSFCAELDEDSKTWTVRSWARSADPPARMIVRSEGGETRTFSLEKTGMWRRVSD